MRLHFRIQLSSRHFKRSRSKTLYDKLIQSKPISEENWIKRKGIYCEKTAIDLPCYLGFLPGTTYKYNCRSELCMHSYSIGRAGCWWNLSIPVSFPLELHALWLGDRWRCRQSAVPIFSALLEWKNTRLSRQVFISLSLRLRILELRMTSEPDLKIDRPSGKLKRKNCHLAAWFFGRLFLNSVRINRLGLLIQLNFPHLSAYQQAHITRPVAASN